MILSLFWRWLFHFNDFINVSVILYYFARTPKLYRVSQDVFPGNNSRINAGYSKETKTVSHKLLSSKFTPTFLMELYLNSRYLFDKLCICNFSSMSQHFATKFLQKCEKTLQKFAAKCELLEWSKLSHKYSTTVYILHTISTIFGHFFPYFL